MSNDSHSLAQEMDAMKAAVAGLSQTRFAGPGGGTMDLSDERSRVNRVKADANRVTATATQQLDRSQALAAKMAKLGWQHWRLVRLVALRMRVLSLVAILFGVARRYWIWSLLMLIVSALLAGVIIFQDELRDLLSFGSSPGKTSVVTSAGAIQGSVGTTTPPMVAMQ